MKKIKTKYLIEDCDVLDVGSRDEIAKLEKIIKIREKRLLQVTNTYNNAAKIVKEAKDNVNLRLQKMETEEECCKETRNLLDDSYIGSSMLPKELKSWLNIDYKLKKAAKLQVDEYKKAVEELSERTELMNDAKKNYLAVTKSVEKLNIVKNKLKN
ncbi:hypothetical protein H0A36_09155 [Endozoicomonas sp. SM1973]|uniref:Uncharacterized protein n=1 Tax=Spartinivicinus marinus TaxID=2994442 RepID=A0A853HWQ9_9GAMM|nr:hypothetical protein [Spartinivicinus marinus]MCX4028145.1 hypothetical protein [Spartinivicinus marinus]NYZ66180.1 hypothetical protein [Spartinivicinus marinus]